MKKLIFVSILLTSHLLMAKESYYQCEGLACPYTQHISTKLKIDCNNILVPQAIVKSFNKSGFTPESYARISDLPFEYTWGPNQTQGPLESIDYRKEYKERQLSGVWHVPSNSTVQEAQKTLEFFKRKPVLVVQAGVVPDPDLPVLYGDAHFYIYEYQHDKSEIIHGGGSAGYTSDAIGRSNLEVEAIDFGKDENDVANAIDKGAKYILNNFCK